MKKLPALAAACIALAFPFVARAQNAPVDWKTLAAEFSKDEAAASAKYQGQMLAVSGPVAAIAAGDMTLDDPSVAVTLSTPDGPGPDVKCLFEQQDLEPNTETQVTGDNSEVLLCTMSEAGAVLASKPMVQLGQNVTVTGTFVGYEAGDIVFRHCRLGSK